MAVSKHYLRKRDYLWDPRRTSEELGAAGREFLAEEAYSEALDFFERARDAEGISEIKRIALAEGDTFLLARLERYDRRLITPADWKEAARAAKSAGRDSMAAFAQRKIDPPKSVAPAQAPGEAPLEEGAVPAAPGTKPIEEKA